MLKTNIPASTESAITYFAVGEDKLDQQHNEREKSKLHTLRVGNAGCMTGPDTCIGACPQSTLARFLGHQLPTVGSEGYFQGGVANETIWEQMITAADLDFKCEEDIPVKHTLPSGTNITGRPDMVLGDYKGEEFIPRLVIELKACQAANSAAKKLLLEKPDDKHLIQAAAYSMFLEVPAVLVYTSNVSGGIPNYFTAREAGTKEVSFGKIEFQLGWEDGNLYYKKGNARYETIVTQQGILDFYSNIDRMAKEKNPGLIYQDMTDIHGDMLPYNPRDYSDINMLVSDDLSFDQWIEEVRQVCGQSYQIKLKKKKYVVVEPGYEVESFKYVKSDKEIKTFETLAAARKFVKESK